MNDSNRLSEIKRRWRIRKIITQWQNLSNDLRAKVISELEETAREITDHDHNQAQARLIAADALEAIAEMKTSLTMDNMIEDVQYLLEEIKHLDDNKENSNA